MTHRDSKQHAAPDQSALPRSGIDKLLQVMRMLRDKQHGCPWDLEQTIASLAPYTLEEVYEVVDAIESEDMVDLRDELGDLLFQVVFYAQIAAEQSEFDFNDIANAITAKLVRRHPHVFPDGDVAQFGQPTDISAEQVVVNWETIKQGEREAKQRERGGQGQPEPSGVLDDVPRALPALERARKLQNRAARVGFDWNELAPVLAKLREEIAEFETAVGANDQAPESQARITHELGDMLFAVVNVARHCGVEPEMALRGANSRFEQRFRWIERALAAQDKQVSGVALAELDALWEEAKQSGL